MGEEQAIVFRLNDHGQGPELVRQVFLERGWLEFEEDEQEEQDWNLWWRSSRFRNSDYENVLPWQRLNHHPKSQAITKKDSLARNLKRMRGVHGPNVYNFSPLAFNLPNDYTRFVAEYARRKEKHPEKELYWICKPADLSRGRGISIFKDVAELQYDSNAVVQQYLMNPLLISGYKFDLRLYVVIPSFDPLHIYIYEEGLVRFSTEKYDLGCLNNLYSHLTNTSINKHGPSYTMDKERVGAGCKWTLTQLRHYFHQVNIDDQNLWLKIINIVTLTVLIQAVQAPKSVNCFELFGFDIIIDENLKPWLLEVNFSPALSSDCPTDVSVKKPMLHDLLDMLNFIEKDKERGAQKFQVRHHPYSLNGYLGGSAAPPSRQAYGRRSVALNSGKTHKTGIGKLPDITRSSDSFVSRQVSEDNSDYEMVPIIPGCGLPSVQQTAQRVQSGSGRSSTSSNHSSEERLYNKGPSLRKGKKIIVRKDSRGNLKQTTRYPQKMESKVSIYSDSAISSYSGSSDNSDRSLLTESERFSASSEDAKRIPRAHTRHSLSPRQRTRKGLRDEGIDVSSSSSTFQSSNLDENTPKKHVHLSFTANPIATKSYLITRSSPALYPIQRQRSLPRAKPWHSAKPVETSHSYTPKNLQDRFGGLVRVFPMNEATKRGCHNPDAKVVIRECQKWLKSVTASVKNPDAVVETPALWRPLKKGVQAS